MTEFAVLFRTDGNSSIGYGHVMRMLALADIINSDFNIFFAIKNTSDWLYTEIMNCYPVIHIPNHYSPADEIVYLSENLPSAAALIILDGYNFDTSYQHLIRAKMPIKIISIDDYQPYKYISDVVINHAGMIEPNQFEKNENTKLLLGPDYALIRRVFNHAAKSGTRRISKIDTALISLGGTDPDLYHDIVVNLSRKGIKKIFIVVNNIANFESLQTTHSNLELFSNLEAMELMNLMNRSDIAILSASTLCYEFCSVSGGLFILQTAENQKFIYNFIIRSKCGFEYNEFDAVFSLQDIIQRLNSQVQMQRKYFNGQNEANLQKAIFQTALSDKFRLKRACAEDLMLYFNWTNDFEARQNSFNKEPIALETHKSWFYNKMSNTNCALYTLWAENIPLGSIRFDLSDGEALLSYTIDKEFRNKGLGSMILKMGISELSKEYIHLKTINGYVNQSNSASLNSFLKVGFKINPNPIYSHENFNYYSLNISR